MKKNQHFLWIIPVGIWITVVWGFNFNGLYGQDAHEYLRYSRSLTGFIVHGTPPGDYFWPVLYPLLCSITALVFPSVFSMQLISFLSYIGTVWFLDQLINLIYGKDDKTLFPYLFVVFLMSPFILRASLLSMSDMTAAFFVTSSAYHFLSFNRTKKTQSFIWGVTLAAMAFHCRYVTAVLLILPASLSLTELLKQRNGYGLLGGLLGSLFVFTPHLLIRSSAPIDFIGHEWLKEWSLLNYFGTAFSTVDGQLVYPLPNIVYSFIHVFHPAYFTFAIFFIPFIKNVPLKNKQWMILFISTLIYSLFIAGIPYQNKRFLLIVFPLVTLLFYPAWKGLTTFLAQKKLLKLSLLLAILLQTALFIRALTPLYSLNKLEQKVAKTISNWPHHSIYGFGMDIGLKTYLPNRQWNSLFTAELNSFEKESLVLFNEQKFAYQWEGKTPMNNWYRLNDQYDLQLIEDFEKGWKLYEIR